MTTEVSARYFSDQSSDSRVSGTLSVSSSLALTRFHFKRINNRSVGYQRVVFAARPAVSTLFVAVVSFSAGVGYNAGC